MQNTTECVLAGRQANGQPLLSELYPGRFAVGGPFSVHYWPLAELTEWIGGVLPRWSGWNPGRQYGSDHCIATFPVLLASGTSADLSGLYAAEVCGQVVLTNIPALPPVGQLVAVDEPGKCREVWRRKPTENERCEAEDAAAARCIVVG